jgi:hypothetical protein
MTLRRYDWRHAETGETRETDSHDTPPTDDPAWKRVYSVGVGRVPHAHATPSRPSSGNTSKRKHA